MKVLIVDDDPLIGDMYDLKLKEAGFETGRVADGKKALAMIQDGNWDVVLLDVVLPLMDGFEILQFLKRAAKPHPPIILLTNLGQKEDVDRGQQLGVVDYIIKAHFTPKEVVDKIKYVLGGAEGGAAAPASETESAPAEAKPAPAAQTPAENHD